MSPEVKSDCSVQVLLYNQWREGGTCTKQVVKCHSFPPFPTHHIRQLLGRKPRNLRLFLLWSLSCAPSPAADVGVAVILTHPSPSPACSRHGDPALTAEQDFCQPLFILGQTVLLSCSWMVFSRM